MNPRISVVVPMYNEEANAENAVGSLLSVMPSIAREFEILVIESGSTDKTAEIADDLANVDPRVRVIHQINREGLGSAIRLGFANSRMDFILYIDGDEPFDTGGVARAIPLLEQNGAVIGYRIGPRESFRRKLYSSVYNRLIQTVFRTNVRDVNFSMKIFRRDLLKMLDLRSNGCFYDAELVAELRRNRVQIAELGFEYVPRKAGMSSLDRPSIIIAMLWEMARYILRRKKRVPPQDRPPGLTGEAEAQ